MPPSRRHSRPVTPPSRRPKVAGLRRPGTPPAKPAEPATAPAPEVDERPAVEPEPPAAVEVDARSQSEVNGAVPVEQATPEVEREPADTEVIAKPVIGAPDPDVDDKPEPATAQPAPTGRAKTATLRRPSGKSRATGTTLAGNLAQAEADVAERAAQRSGPLRDNTFIWAIALGVTAVLLVGLAVWFRGLAESRSGGADVNNRALLDPGAQSEVVRQVRGAIEKAFSYNYTDLDSTARAVQDNLAGKALCEHEALFGEVKRLAPEQKMVLTAQVIQIGVTRLEADRARLQVFLNQRSTRVDQNQTVGAVSQFAVDAEKQGDKWRIINLDMLGQPRPDGKPLPQC